MIKTAILAPVVNTPQHTHASVLPSSSVISWSFSSGSCLTLTLSPELEKREWGAVFRVFWGSEARLFLLGPREGAWRLGDPPGEAEGGMEQAGAAGAGE